MTEETTPRVEAEFIWEPKEYASIVNQLTREMMRSRGWRVTFVIAGGWLIWTLGRLGYYGLEGGDLGGMSFAMLPWLLVAVLWIWMLRKGSGWLAARRARKLDSRVDRLQRHVIDSEGLHVDMGTGGMSLPWTGMDRIRETDEHFLWYWHARSAHYTPKRVLTDRDIDVIRELALHYASDRAQLLS